MKIEKINDNQIRCTLTKQDLADRQINLKELAYGSEKAKMLFRDMIQQANYEFGFETNDIPLMVEAIPLSSESLILLITKVEYPEELDTRFSRFSDPDEDELFASASDASSAFDMKGADDVLGIFNRLREEKLAAESKKQQSAGENDRTVVSVPEDFTRMFEFESLGQVQRFSRVLGDYYDGRNELYKDEKKNRFYLFLHKDAHTPEQFNRVCNIACEYAGQKNYTSAVGAYFLEHGTRIAGPDALAMLAEL
ncbi:MAG: adaptor protein MecA [Agathobacter sp.]